MGSQEPLRITEKEFLQEGRIMVLSWQGNLTISLSKWDFLLCSPFPFPTFYIGYGEVDILIIQFIFLSHA